MSTIFFRILNENYGIKYPVTELGKFDLLAVDLSGDLGCSEFLENWGAGYPGTKLIAFWGGIEENSAFDREE